MIPTARKGGRHYLAVIGVVRPSRAVKDRAQLQKRIEKGLAAANRESGSAVAAEFVVTLGDEFQGLLADPAAAMRTLVRLESAMPGIDIRYALGWGTLATPLKDIALGMDGPCFHAAREALTRGKRHDRWVTVAGWGPERDEILNGIFALMGAVRAGWTPTQADTVALMRRSATQIEAAAARNVSTSTVNKALRGALYKPMIEIERAVERVLARFALESE